MKRPRDIIGSDDTQSQPAKKPNLETTEAIPLSSSSSPATPITEGSSSTSQSTGTVLSATCTLNNQSLAGSFEYRREWQVVPPTKGFIVQHVTRTFDVFKLGEKQKMTADEIKKYIRSETMDAYPHMTEYWELWEVDEKGRVGGDEDDPEDTFQLCSITPNGSKRRNTTKGTFIITGEARFYPFTKTPSELGFKREVDAPAGGLWSTTTDPTSALGPPMSSPVKITVTVTWDTTHKSNKYVNGDGYSVVRVSNS